MGESGGEMLNCLCTYPWRQNGIKDKRTTRSHKEIRYMQLFWQQPHNRTAFLVTDKRHDGSSFKWKTVIFLGTGRVGGIVVVRAASDLIPSCCRLSSYCLGRSRIRFIVWCVPNRFFQWSLGFSRVDDLVDFCIDLF